MASSITIRNFTPTAIVWKSLERFEDPNTEHSKVTAFPSSNNAQSVALSASKLGVCANTYIYKELNISLGKWESCTLYLPASNAFKSENTTTFSATTHRITIQNQEQEQFRTEINLSHTKKDSRLFTPLTRSPTTSYTALYHPTAPTPNVTIHSLHLTNYAQWMRSLPNALPISSISLPGTHNSHTYYRGLPSVRCQVIDISTQLANGIRFLDIRVQPASATDVSRKDLYLVHGAFPVSLTGIKYLAPVLDAVYSFLSDNPSETVLMSLKREGVGNATDAHLATVFQKHYIDHNPEKWFHEERLPYLREVRGKIVLVRRFKLSDENSEPTSGGECKTRLGLDATAWPHNSTHAAHGSFCVQDFCEISHTYMIPDKLQHCNAHLVRAASLTHFVPGINTDTINPVPPEPLYLNFLSGSNFFRVGTWPEKIAKIVNRGVEEWICTR